MSACGDAGVELRMVGADDGDEVVAAALEEGKRSGAVVVISGVEDDVLAAQPPWLEGALHSTPAPQ